MRLLSSNLQWQWATRGMLAMKRHKAQNISKYADEAMKKPDGWAELEAGYDLKENGQFGQAFALYLKAAKFGNGVAQVGLGNFYDEGKGCEKNPKQAVFWYKRAVRSGCAPGAYNLGVHYRQLGNQRWAAYWFTRAIQMGDEDALLELNLLKTRN